MAWDDVKNFLGQALGDVSLFLRPASTWGTIPEIVEKRHEEAATPAARQSLIGSPFRAGLLGVGGKDVGGKFQPDLPEGTAANVLQPVHDPLGNPIPGVYIGPDGKLFKGGLTFAEVVDQAKKIDPNFDLSKYRLSGLQGGGVRVEPTPGPLPPPPAGMVPKGARLDPKGNRYVPYYGLPDKPKPGAQGMTRQEAIDFGLDPDALGITDETPPATTRTPTTTAPPVVPPDMKPASELPAGPLPGKPAAFIFHHTGGEGDVAGVERTLQQRHLGVQYVMDRDGQIFTTTTLPGQQQMQRGSGAGAGLSNANTVGMEIIAKDDADVTPAQRAAAKKFIEDHYPDTPVYGHGEVNPGHKQATEGMSVVTDIRTARGQQPKSRLGPSGGAPAPPSAAPAAKPKLLKPDEWLAIHPDAEISRGPHGVTVTMRSPPPPRPKAAPAEKPPSPQALQEIEQLKILDDNLSSLETMLASPDVTGRLGPVRGRAAWLKYRLGASSDPLFDHFQTLEDLIGNLSVGRLARASGSRSYLVWQALSAHKPQAGDDPELTKSKVTTLRNLVEHTQQVSLALQGVPASKVTETLKNIPDMPDDQIVDPDIRASLGLPPLTQGGAQTPMTTRTITPTTTTTLPSTGDPQQDFDRHLDQWRQPQ